MSLTDESNSYLTNYLLTHTQIDTCVIPKSSATVELKKKDKLMNNKTR